MPSAHHPIWEDWPVGPMPPPEPGLRYEGLYRLLEDPWLDLARTYPYITLSDPLTGDVVGDLPADSVGGQTILQFLLDWVDRHPEYVDFVNDLTEEEFRAFVDTVLAGLRGQLDRLLGIVGDLITPGGYSEQGWDPHVDMPPVTTEGGSEEGARGAPGGDAGEATEEGGEVAPGAGDGSWSDEGWDEGPMGSGYESGGTEAYGDHFALGGPNEYPALREGHGEDKGGDPTDPSSLPEDPPAEEEGEGGEPEGGGQESGEHGGGAEGGQEGAETGDSGGEDPSETEETEGTEGGEEEGDEEEGGGDENAFIPPELEEIKRAKRNRTGMLVDGAWADAMTALIEFTQQFPELAFTPQPLLDHPDAGVQVAIARAVDALMADALGSPEQGWVG